MHRNLNWFFAGCLVALPALGAGFVAESASKVGATVSVPACGAITGLAGPIVDWTHSTIGNKKLKSVNGEVGVEYGGAAEQICSPLATPLSASTTLRHRYRRNGGPSKFKIKCDTEGLASGSAGVNKVELGDWWFNPTIDVRDNMPTIKLIGVGERGEEYEITTAGWSTQSSAWTKTWVLNTGGVASPGVSPESPPLSSSQTGGGTPPSNPAGMLMEAETALLGQSSEVKKIDIRWTFDVLTNRDADNTIVTSWRQVIKPNMETEAS